jgi:hypothetical protein
MKSKRITTQQTIPPNQAKLANECISQTNKANKTANQSYQLNQAKLTSYKQTKANDAEH